MQYSIVFTPAEDIVGVIDAVLAKPFECSKTFICEFADISLSQADNALLMAQELGLISYDPTTLFYSSNSFLARLIVSARNDNHKAAVMRLVLEQYEPYIAFKVRLAYTNSIDAAARQVKLLYSMNSTYKDIKNTIISIATYCKSMLNDGANSYKLNHDEVSYLEILELALKFKANDDNALRQQLGDNIYEYLNKDNVFSPLSDAYSMIQNISTDPKAPILYAGNAFESFLQQIADDHTISLVGKAGIGQKSNAMASILSKKHRGMIEYISQVRNAADHGADPEEGGRTWDISEETSQMYPIIVTTIIKDIFNREHGRIIV